MENSNKEQLFDELWIKLRTAMKEHEGEDFVGRSDIENGMAEMNSDYLQQSEKIVVEALKSNVTEEEDEKYEEDNEKLTEHLKKVKTNIFRYKFREKDENGNVKEYRFSFEEDKIVVNIRDSDNNILYTIEFEYKDYFKTLFYDIIGDLSANDESSIFSKKNRYNSSIANTVLKYYAENKEYNIVEETCSFLESKGLKVSRALVEASAETGSENIFIFCLNKKYPNLEVLTIEDMFKIIESSIISGNAVIYYNDFISEIEKQFDAGKDPVLEIINNYNYSRLHPKKNNSVDLALLLGTVCTSKEVDIEFVQYFLYNYEDYYSRYDMVRLFERIYEPRIAKIVLDELKEKKYNIHSLHQRYATSRPLYYIAKSGNIEVAQFILKEMSKEIDEKDMKRIINEERDKDGNTIVANAVKNKNTDFMKFLLSQFEIDVNLTYYDTDLILNYAITNRDIEMIKLLISQPKIDINKRGYKGKTALITAVIEGDSDIVKLLLSQPNIEVDISDDKGMSAISYAFANKNDEIYKLLSEKDELKIDKNLIRYVITNRINNLPLSNFNVEDLSIEDTERLIEDAVEYESVEMLRVLLQKDGINLNNCLIFGQPMIFRAFFNCYTSEGYYENKTFEVSKLLLETGKIDINKKDEHEYTVLYHAVKLTFIKKRDDILKTILSKYDNIDLYRENGRFLGEAGGETVFDFVLETSKNLSIINLFCTKWPDIDINRKNGLGKTPLDYAVENGNVEIIEHILATRMMYINEKFEKVEEKKKETDKLKEILNNKVKELGNGKVKKNLEEIVKNFDFYFRFKDLDQDQKNKCNIF